MDQRVVDKSSHQGALLIIECISLFEVLVVNLARRVCRRRSFNALFIDACNPSLIRLLDVLLVWVRLRILDDLVVFGLLFLAQAVNRYVVVAQLLAYYRHVFYVQNALFLL